MPVPKLVLAVVLMSLLGAPATLAAQQLSARDSAIARLHAGQTIQLTLAGSGRLAGRAGVVVGDTLDVAQDDAVRRIPIPAIDTLWVRGGSGTTGAIVGGVIVGVLGALAVVAAAGACEYDCGSTGVQALGGFLLGAAVGVPLGAVIGGRFPKWKRTFP